MPVFGPNSGGGGGSSAFDAIYVDLPLPAGELVDEGGYYTFVPGTTVNLGPAFDALEIGEFINGRSTDLPAVTINIPGYAPLTPEFGSGAFQIVKETDSILSFVPLSSGIGSPSLNDATIAARIAVLEADVDSGEPWRAETDYEAGEVFSHVVTEQPSTVLDLNGNPVAPGRRLFAYPDDTTSGTTPNVSEWVLLKPVHEQLVVLPDELSSTNFFYARPLSMKLGEMLSIADFGAKEGAAQPDVAPHINEGLEYTLTRDTGGTLYIPSGRWFCRSPVELLRGTNTQAMELKGVNENSILDFRASPNASCLRYDGAGTDGPSFIKLSNFAIRGDETGTKTGVNADFLSGSIFDRMVFERLLRCVQTENSFAFGIHNSRFNGILRDIVQFNTNAHSFRMTGCRGNQIATDPSGGAVINFNTDPNDNESHSIWIAGNNFDGIGTLVRTSASSGGLTGLSWLGNYSEGFIPGKQFFDFSNDGVRGFVCQGGSFSQAAAAGTPDVQIIDNVDGGHFGGNRINGITFEQGANTKFFDWSAGNNAIGTGGAVPDGWVTPTYEAPWTTQAGRQPAQYRSDEQRMVHLRGAIDYGAGVPVYTGGIDNAVFTLPPELRPPQNMSFSTHAFNGGILYTATVVVLRTTGTVLVHTTDDRRVSLDGISFSAAI